MTVALAIAGAMVFFNIGFIAGAMWASRETER